MSPNTPHGVNTGAKGSSADICTTPQCFSSSKMVRLNVSGDEKVAKSVPEHQTLIRQATRAATPSTHEVMSCIHGLRKLHKAVKIYGARRTSSLGIPEYPKTEPEREQVL
jgi:hypothetical protein